MNYYIQSRCRDFHSLLRESPDREIIKEIGDLVTIYHLIKEDLDYYKNLIKKYEDDYHNVMENIAKIQKRE